MHKKYDDLTEVCIGSERIFEGVVVHLYKDKVRLQDGSESVREVLRDCRAVCVLPLDKDGNVTVVSQFRYAHDKVLCEIPAGKLDFAGEDRREAALRELREETGAICETLTHIGDIVPSPAILTEKISMYLAEGLTFGETEYDEGEFIEIVKIPLPELVDMIMRGEIEDAKTQTAILKIWHLKNK